TDPGPEENAMAHERWGRVGQMLASFTERDRKFVELYFARGMAPEAVAVAMNISVKTVYSKKNKIRTKLERMARRAPVAANTANASSAANAADATEPQAPQAALAIAA